MAERSGSTKDVAELLDVSRGSVWAAARDEGGIVVGDELIRPIKVGRSLRWPMTPIRRALGLDTPGSDGASPGPALELVPSDARSDGAA